MLAMEIYGVPRNHKPILKNHDRKHFVRNCKKNNNQKIVGSYLNQKIELSDGKVGTAPPPRLNIVSCITINTSASNKLSNV